MSQQGVETPTDSLADFDAARDTFLAAFAQAPDGALAFVPVGDEYAVGTLLMHLCDPIARYLSVLDKIEAAGYGAIDLGADPAAQQAEAQLHQRLLAARPTGADRAPLLAELDAAHERVRQRMTPLDPATFARQAPVVYSLGTDPYPTSARDIMGWLTDHYDEHTAQVAKMLAEWQSHARP